MKAYLLGRLVFLVGGLLAGCAWLEGPSTPPPPTTITPQASRLPAGFNVQGHQGARGLRPENTLAAFEAALDLGVTTLDLDVHLTSDNVPVIWDDPALSPQKCRLDPGQVAGTYGPNDQPLFDRVQSYLVSGKTPIRKLPYAPLQWQPYTCDLNPNPAQFPAQTTQGRMVASRAGTPYRVVDLRVR